MVSIVQMVEDSCASQSDEHSCWSTDLDDSAATVKISNQHWLRRRSVPVCTPGCCQRMLEDSRWESFPSGRRMSAPPRRPMKPPRSTGSTCSSLSTSSDSSSQLTPPPLMTTLRQESQGCSAPRVPQRKSSLDAIKRPGDCDCDSTDQPIALRRIVRRQCSDEQSILLAGKLSYNTPSKTLRLPSWQSSSQT